MKNPILIAIVVGCLSPLAMAQKCRVDWYAPLSKEQSHGDWTSCPVANAVARMAGDDDTLGLVYSVEQYRRFWWNKKALVPGQWIRIEPKLEEEYQEPEIDHSEGMGKI